MQSARRLAHLRSAYALAATLVPFVAPAAVFAIPGRHATLEAVATIAAVILGAVGYFWAMLMWRPRCPRCAARARFVMHHDGYERLDCPNCRYSEPTGYTNH